MSDPKSGLGGVIHYSTDVAESPIQAKLLDLKDRRAEALKGGPDRAVARQRDKGKMLARERIEYLFDREHQIGHAYFMKCETIGDVHETMRHRIIPLLAEYFYEDWSKVALVLGDGEGEGRFLTRIKLDVPAGIQSDGFGEDRYRWQVRSSFADDAYNDFG